MANYKEKLKQIKTIIFDIDGVMTDGNVLLTPDGDMLRTMNVKDGYALHVAVKKGYRVIILSGGHSESVKSRFAGLGINNIYLGIGNKLDTFKKIILEDNLNPAEILYMGDDIPDYQVMKEVGIAASPIDAAQEIKKISHYISPFKGGNGCVRDILEQLMKVQNTWFDDDGFHW